MICVAWNNGLLGHPNALQVDVPGAGNQNNNIHSMIIVFIVIICNSSGSSSSSSSNDNNNNMIINIDITVAGRRTSPPRAAPCSPPWCSPGRARDVFILKDKE